MLAAHHTYTSATTVDPEMDAALFATHTQTDPTQVYSDAIFYATCRQFNTDACSCKVVKHEIDLSMTNQTRSLMLCYLSPLSLSVVSSWSSHLKQRRPLCRNTAPVLQVAQLNGQAAFDIVSPTGQRW